MFATILRQTRPPSPLAGRLAIQSLLFALGEGTFMTGSAVFFTQIVGPQRRPGGPRPDHRGRRGLHRGAARGQAGRPLRAQAVWAVSAAGQAGLFTLWPFIDGFGGYVAMAVAMEVVGSLGGAPTAPTRSTCCRPTSG